MTYKFWICLIACIIYKGSCFPLQLYSENLYAQPPIVWVRLPIRPLAVSENAHDSWITWYIMIKLCIRVRVNIV